MHDVKGVIKNLRQVCCVRRMRPENKLLDAAIMSPAPKNSVAAKHVPLVPDVWHWVEGQVCQDGSINGRGGDLCNHD